MQELKKEENTDYVKQEKLLNIQNDNKMAKKNIHPKWYSDSKVYCDGKHIMTVGSTKNQLNVDIWSGNHPFFTGSQRIIDTEGRVERFMRKYNIKDS
uniref:ribosomal protein L31 n=1 Tax=Lithothamnion corallioides TaxID=1277934 RepID=UPI0023EFF62B|nr:ribosomal protein L31 [Lithothamnion corallioides]WEA77065.1 ribosomal protein L31 [Lithothamnion corallioides]